VPRHADAGASGPAGRGDDLLRERARPGNCLIRAISPESDGRPGYGSAKGESDRRGDRRRRRESFGAGGACTGAVGGIGGGTATRALADGRARAVGWCQQRGSGACCQHACRGSIDAADVHACMGAANQTPHTPSMCFLSHQKKEEWSEKLKNPK